MHIWSTLLSALSLNQEIIQNEQTQMNIKHEKKAIQPCSSSIPVLIWHGMGDSYDSESMQWAIETIHSRKPELDIYSISLDPDNQKDQQASIIGDSMTYIFDVCNKIQDLDTANGFNLIGFSQGGLFLRSLVETCNGINFNNLITFGSPHNGITDLPPCENHNIICERRNHFLKSKMYDNYVQENSIQAQYFRDVSNYDKYLEKSLFLKYANNELFTNSDYYDNFVKLNKFVMIMFDQDNMLVPKESAWFYDLEQTGGKIVPFTETESYKYDLIGLKTLADNGKIEFLVIDDLHMRISEEDLFYITEMYL